MVCLEWWGNMWYYVVYGNTTIKVAKDKDGNPMFEDDGRILLEYFYTSSIEEMKECMYRTPPKELKVVMSIIKDIPMFAPVAQ